MKIDDRMHAHRKTRVVLRSHPDKDRDAAPMGLWVLAGSWASQNDTDGWVPVHELDRFDDDWETLVARLVKADYWWPEVRDREEGYGFVDWAEWNTSRERQSAVGRFGNHERWHVRRGVVKPGCEHCPQDPESSGLSGGDIPTRSQGDIGGDSETVAIPVPVPDPIPTKNPCASADAERVDTVTEQLVADFDEWYGLYPRKKSKGAASRAYRAARKKATHEELMAGLRRALPDFAQRPTEKIPYPATWLNGEAWLDEMPTPAESEPIPSHYLLPSEVEYAPSGMTDEEADAWQAAQEARRRQAR